MNEWMDESKYMDGWMDGSKDGKMDGWMNRRMEVEVGKSYRFRNLCYVEGPQTTAKHEMN